MYEFMVKEALKTHKAINFLVRTKEVEFHLSLIHFTQKYGAEVV